jgi:hypothetical protein
MLFLAAVSVAGVTIFATAVQAQGKGNTWYSLRQTFTQGETLRYDIRANMTGMTTMSGAPGGQQSTPANMQMKTGLKINVLEVDPTGTATAKLTMDEVAIDAQQMGQSVEMRIGPTGMKIYMGGQLMLDSSQTGGESPIGGMPGLGGLGGDAGDFQIFGKGVTVAITRHLGFGEPGEAQEAAAAFLEQLLLPRRLLRPGDQWALDLSALAPDAPAQVPGLTVESTFEGIELFKGKRCAKIVTVLDVDVSKVPVGDLGGAQIDTAKSKVAGRQTAYLDTEGGRLLRVDGNVSLAFSGSGLPMMVMGAPMAPGGGQSSVSVDSAMKLTYEVALKE